MDKQDPTASQHALKTMANYLLSLDLAMSASKSSPFRKPDVKLFMPLYHRLLKFITTSTNLSDAIITLSFAINIVGLPFDVATLLPLPDIVAYGTQQLKLNEDHHWDHHLAWGIVGLLLAVAEAPRLETTTLLQPEVVTYLQLVRSIEPMHRFLPSLLNMMYHNHDRKPLETPIPPVLSNFLYKDGACTAQYIMALLEGGAMRSLLNHISHVDTICNDALSALYGLSFLGAEKLLDYKGSIHLLLHKVAKQAPLVALGVAWFLSLRKVARRKMTVSDRELLRDFASEFGLPKHDRYTDLLKIATILNMESSGMHHPYSS